MKIQNLNGVYYATFRINGDKRFIEASSLNRAIAIVLFILAK